jgi:TRAP-type uncharacterized transport system substrate-binding protein
MLNYPYHPKLLTAGEFSRWIGGIAAPAAIRLTLWTAHPGSGYERAGQALQKLLQLQGFHLEQLAKGQGDLAFAQQDAFIL